MWKTCGIPIAAGENVSTSIDFDRYRPRSLVLPVKGDPNAAGRFWSRCSGSSQRVSKPPI
jgi:hypothetical protein